MPKLRIELDCSNSAFEGAPGYEVSRILKTIIKATESGNLADLNGKRLMDVNGNTVGKVEVIED